MGARRPDLSRRIAAEGLAADYVAAQSAGAPAGALALLTVWPDQPAGLGATVPSVGAGSALVYEFLLTDILLWIFLVAPVAGAVAAASAYQFVRLAARADVVVTMGCGDECPYIQGKRYVDWELEDPSGRPLDEVRRIRDDIAERVRRLAAELG